MMQLMFIILVAVLTIPSIVSVLVLKIRHKVFGVIVGTVAGIIPGWVFAALSLFPPRFEGSEWLPFITGGVGLIGGSVLCTLKWRTIERKRALRAETSVF